MRIPVPKFKKLTPQRLAIDLIVLACIILLGVSSWLWWSKIVMNPGRALDDAIANSLHTRSVTKHVTQVGTTGSVDQVSYLSFFPGSIGAQTDTVLTQGIGSNSASVNTETIGTTDRDFVRYTDVKGADNLSGAQRLKTLLGVWAERNQDIAKGQRVSFLNESMFGIVPFGYFNDAEKSQLIGLINQKGIYKYTSATRSIENRRPVYIYTLALNPADLVDVMHEYVRLSGAGDPSQFDSTQYKGLGVLHIQLTVDILSRQIIEVQYPTGRVENYSGYNLYKQINLPADTIPIEELQKRLQGQGSNA
ncbi:MAG TPA: hypothetical protein VFW77_00085 [Candidatus Saccharimonadales bacterium]|nr:hypothetical protein [Candidatus Saccharimonadales bacterium]